MFLSSSEDLPQSAAAPPATQPAIEGPITYYNNNCNRCHGQVDAAYPDSKNPPKGEALKKVIQEMAEGPAQVPLDETGLAEQVKLHEAIFGGGPYVWVDPTSKGGLRGEIIPGTKVTVVDGDRKTAAHVEGETVAAPSAGRSLELERNGKTRSVP